MERFAPLAVLGGFLALVVGIIMGYIYLAGAIAAALGGGFLAWVVAVIGAAVLGVFLAELALLGIVLCIWVVIIVLGLIIAIFR